MQNRTSCDKRRILFHYNTIAIGSHQYLGKARKRDKRNNIRTNPPFPKDTKEEEQISPHKIAHRAKPSVSISLFVFIVKSALSMKPYLFRLRQVFRLISVFSGEPSHPFLFGAVTRVPNLIQSSIWELRQRDCAGVAPASLFRFALQQSYCIVAATKTSIVGPKILQKVGCWRPQKSKTTHNYVILSFSLILCKRGTFTRVIQKEQILHFSRKKQAQPLLCNKKQIPPKKTTNYSSFRKIRMLIKPIN